MTKYSKILSVFVTFASLAFMGFAAVNAVGGPNWQAEAARETDYIFENSGGENPTWSVRWRRDSEGAKLKTTPSLAAAVVAAREHAIQQQRDELEQIETRIPKVEADIKLFSTVIAVDLQAMKKREDGLAQQITVLNQRANQLAAEAVAKAGEAQQIRAEAELRRADVFRLREQLDEIQTEQFQVEEQKRRLDDLLIRANGVLQRLEQRQVRLKEAGAKLPDYEEAVDTP